MARWHFCNVFRSGKDARQVWQFLAANKKFTVNREESKLPTESLTAKIVAKDWETLLQPKLNIAWLPADTVFLRVVQLPKAEPDETRSMMELQLEKLSPMPVAQVVWSYETFDQPGNEMQTAIVILVARHFVERFLGDLEALGYLADRLELPFVDQLRSSEFQKDGAWVFAGWGNNPHACLVAWWHDGVLSNLSLVHLPDDETKADVFRGQIRQMIWTGELEGWLADEPLFHLVAAPESDLAREWAALFEPGQAVETIAPLSFSDLAALTARRVVSNGSHTNLLPTEYTARYRQQFVDRLWMRGLAAAAALYMIGVAIYFGWIEIANWKLDGVTTEVANLSLSYTNTLQMAEEVKVLQDQLAFQFAALDCWKAVADNLPSELTMKSINFGERKVTYFGEATADDTARVYDFNEAIRKFKVKERKLFSNVNAPSISQRGGRQIAWNFSCDLDLEGTK
jgi:hypothetical protein